MQTQMKNQAGKRRAQLEQLFRERFHRAPERTFSSPGRAEIIGNHTDHNLGRVMVSAISCDILCMVASRNDGVVEIVAEDFRPISFSVRDLSMREREKGRSVALARGVLYYLQQQGYSFGGFSAATHSTIFRGAGVSSSAAFEVLVGEIVNALYLGGRLAPSELARAGQFAENTFFGKPCGLLDQTGIALGGFHMIDFSEGSVERVPAPLGYRMVLTNTGGSHASLTSHYADIRREMGEVAACFGKRYLREVDCKAVFDRLPALRRQVSDRALLRAFHFYEENERVADAAEALKGGDLSRFFACIRQSGESSLGYLQNCYLPGEISQPIVLALKISDRILKDGAFRMQGGGFAGTVLAFCRDGQEESYKREMARIFGADHVFEAQFRDLGTCELRQ